MARLRKVADSDQLIIRYIPMKKREGYVEPEKPEEKSTKKKGGRKKGSSKKKGGKGKKK